MYHCSIKVISRSSGKSAVASAAYRSKEKLKDQETGITHDYTKKGGVIFNEIALPEYAPAKYKDRSALWNEVQKIEKRSDAQLAREVEVALPVELSRKKQIEVVREYVKSNFVEKGMCADWALHDKGDGNPHVHIMLTTRPIKENGEWGEKQKSSFKLDEAGQKVPVIDPETGLQKVRIRKGKGEEKIWERTTVFTTDWNEQSKAEEWRANWAKECNKYLSPENQIDHTSYKRQGSEQIPTIHEGKKARQMEKEGKIADRCQINRDIKEYNNLNDEISKLEQLKEKIKQSMVEFKEALYERFEQLQQHRVSRTTNESIRGNGIGESAASKGEPGKRLDALSGTRQSRRIEDFKRAINQFVRNTRDDLFGGRTDQRNQEVEKRVSEPRNTISVTSENATRMDIGKIAKEIGLENSSKPIKRGRKR